MTPDPALACHASPDAIRATGPQRITYVLVKGAMHHYPTHHAATQDRDLMNGKGIRIVRALNCAKHEIPMFDAAGEMLVTLKQALEWMKNQEPWALGADGLALAIEIARTVKRATRDIAVTSARHGEVEGDPAIVEDGP